MITLNSSVIAGVSYSEWSRSLVVYFRSGRAYTHLGVPVEVYRGLIEAESAGRFYNAYIRGRYR